MGCALDGLVARGYDAVRIDAFPHLMLAGPERDFTLKSWGEPWGAPGRVTVRIVPALVDFVSACARRGVKVALSSWYREDDRDVRMALADPARMTAAWDAVLRTIDRAGLIDGILWVDVCNEYPGPLWAPFLKPSLDWEQWTEPRALDYVRLYWQACVRPGPRCRGAYRPIATRWRISGGAICRRST